MEFFSCFFLSLIFCDFVFILPVQFVSTLFTLLRMTSNKIVCFFYFYLFSCKSHFLKLRLYNKIYEWNELNRAQNAHRKGKGEKKS